MDPSIWIKLNKGKESTLECKLALTLQNFPEDPIILGGDFNVMLSSRDKYGGIIPSPKSMQEFNKFIDSNALKDCMPLNRLYTWTNTRQGFFYIVERLDIFIVNHIWTVTFNLPKAKILSLSGFGHFVLQVDIPLTPIFQKGVASFRFQQMWFRDVTFLPKLPEWWLSAPFFQGSRIFKFCNKLLWIKSRIKERNI